MASTPSDEARRQSEEEEKKQVEAAYQSTKQVHETEWATWNMFEKKMSVMKTLIEEGSRAIPNFDHYFEEVYKEEKILGGEDIRVRDVEFAILSTPRISIGTELDVLKKHVEDLFCWFSDASIRRTAFAAPCMPIIQSSGTGKTKLLSDLKKYAKEKENTKEKDDTEETMNDDYQVLLISCLPKDNRRDRTGGCVYDKYLDFTGNRKSNKEYLSIELERTVSGSKCVWMFDEAQELSTNGAVHLHALQRLLRRKRKCKVIAFVTGTNHNLANCYPDKEERLASREGEDSSRYYQSGRRLYDPMFRLYTMGCFASKITFHDDYGNNQGASEFDLAVPYGRPLFARMLLEEEPSQDMTYPVKATCRISDKELGIIVTRMLLNDTLAFRDIGNVGAPNTPNLLPFASVWATRVQLGSVHTIVAETLVARGYAHLTSFCSVRAGSDGSDVPRPTAGFTHMPDPVCACMAMCLMQEGWKLDTGASSEDLCGLSKQTWAEKLKQICSSGLCRPARGDLGELVAAAYLLFCGDELRYERDTHFRTFSVSLSAWVQKLMPGVSMKGVENCSCSINFLQFCRNGFRLGLADVCQQAFLKYIYNSCSAVYADEGCPFYDAYASIRCKAPDKDDDYVPLIISIKTREGFTDRAAKTNVDSIVEKLYEAGQFKALILVVLLDRNEEYSSDGDDVFAKPADHVTDDEAMTFHSPGDQEMTTPKRPRKNTRCRAKAASTDSFSRAPHECHTDIVSRVIRIPNQDRFHLTDVVHSVSRSLDEGVAFASHSYAGIVESTSLQGRRKRDNGLVSSVLTVNNSSASDMDVVWNRRYAELNAKVAAPKSNR